MFPIHDDTERIHGRPYVNYSLIAINAVVFIVEVWRTGFFTNQQETAIIFNTYGTIPKFLFEGDLPSILTSMFMHGGVAHLVGNMVFLYVFGDNMEDRFGHVKYFFIYIAWGTIATFANGLYAMNTGQEAVPAIGASGAISGVLGSYLIIFPKAKIFTIIIAFFITTVRIPALAFIPFWFILQIIFAAVGESGGVAYLAHIGGFIAGLVTGYLWKLNPQKMIGFPTLKRADMRSHKERPRLEDAAPLSAPEVIEGPGFYEVIAELRGLSDASDIRANYESETGNVRIVSTGPRKYDVLAKLPEAAANLTVEYIHYLNGIVRIRLAKQ